MRKINLRLASMILGVLQPFLVNTAVAIDYYTVADCNHGKFVVYLRASQGPATQGLVRIGQGEDSIWDYGFEDAIVHETPRSRTETGRNLQIETNSYSITIFEDGSGSSLWKDQDTETPPALPDRPYASTQLPPIIPKSLHCKFRFDTMPPKPTGMSVGNKTRK
jgi:hypothetical protein